MSEVFARQDRVAEMIGRVAVRARQELEGWQTSGPPRDRIQLAYIGFEGDRYVILRDDDRTVLVFTPREWDAFIDGVNKGEFDMDTGILPIKEEVTDELAS
jgi:hypothetical protein